MEDIINLISLQQEVTLLRANGKYKETIDTCYILLNLGTKINDYKSILTAHINLAASFYLIGDTEEAYLSIEDYDKVCRQHGDEEDYIYLYNILVILCEYNKNYNKAKNTINKSIELGLKYKKYNIVSNGYSNYSYLCLMEEDYQLALEKAMQAMEMASLHFPPNPILEFGIKLNIAKALIGLGDIKSSGIMIKNMIEDSILDSHIREKSQCYELMGYWYTKQKKYRDAFDSYTIAKELVESYKDLHLLKNVQEERCKLCEQMNDIHLGYKVQKEYISVLNEISERELSVAAVKFEIKQKYFEMEKKAITDYLTGLYNRDYVETKVNEWLKNGSEKNESIVCIVFDIDSFKSINDD
jgi:tetratricopeptide (TPR) repeat protein